MLVVCWRERAVCGAESKARAFQTEQTEDASTEAEARRQNGTRCACIRALDRTDTSNRIFAAEWLVCPHPGARAQKQHAASRWRRASSRSLLGDNARAIELISTLSALVTRPGRWLAAHLEALSREGRTRDTASKNAT